MKSNFLVLSLTLCAFLPQAMAQDDASGSVEDKMLAGLEKQRERLLEQVERANAKLQTLDSIKAVSNALKEEGNADYSAASKEKDALENRIKAELKELEKSKKSKDKEQVAAAIEKEKEITKQYREEIKPLVEKVKEANTKLAKAESMVSSSYNERRTIAEENLKKAKANLKTLEDDITARQKGKK
jgi:chromosome segregation ATPase